MDARLLLAEALRLSDEEGVGARTANRVSRAREANGRDAGADVGGGGAGIANGH